jgi:hypothetical protein
MEQTALMLPAQTSNGTSQWGRQHWCYIFRSQTEHHSETDSTDTTHSGLRLNITEEETALTQHIQVSDWTSQWSRQHWHYIFRSQTETSQWSRQHWCYIFRSHTQISVPWLTTLSDVSCNYTQSLHAWPEWPFISASFSLHNLQIILTFHTTRPDLLTILPSQP